MSDLTISGVVLHILDEQSGVSKAGKDWNKQDFVIETTDQYPKKIAFTLFGDKTDLLMNIGQGQLVDVSFNLESREYNGRWFHNVNAWKILSGEVNDSVPSNEIPPEPADNGDEPLPF